MRVEDLKNYGTNMHTLSTTVPKEEMKKTQKKMLSTITHELGLWKSLKLVFLIRRKTKGLSKINLDRIRTFCKNEVFIQSKIKDAATFAAIQELTSPEKAKEIYKKILDEVLPEMESIIYPDPDLIKNFTDPFDSIKQYILSIMNADMKEGLHEFEIIEDSPNVLQFNVTRCAWFETKKELGVPEATFQDCYGDEASLPGLLEKVDVKFSRSNTIANGAKFCDFRFERIK
ncbi:MAG: L-2-amino-thiazoline-4-carboxylic acid hydrolase [Promethearchaeota archaeon]